MGFDAIWISPIVLNFEKGQHGYWAKDFYALNPQFGTAQEFSNLSDALQARNMWLMVDIVVNHTGQMQSPSEVNPFNKDSHYHSNCSISSDDYDGNHQGVLEYCRLEGLPDLAQQDNDEVKNLFLQWIHWFVPNQKIDGIRIDTVFYVSQAFWNTFVPQVGVYTLGEVFSTDTNYVASYQNVMDALLNYPV